jgi:membrane-associated phospholipid phosphatase
MKVLLVTIGFLITFPLAAQDSVYRGDAHRFVDATFHTYARPLHWKKAQWLTFGGILAGTAALSFLDKPVHELFVRTEAHFPELVETVGYHYGKPYSAFIVTGGFYLVGSILNDRWAKETGLNLGVTLLTSGLLQTVLKDLSGRARPDTGAGPYNFHIPAKGDIAYHSFPSGHSAVAFGITLVLARRIDSKPVKILLYALAGSTVLSRLHTDAHWLSDIAFGAALAWACDETVRRRLSFNRRPKQSRRISWSATPTSNGLGVVGKF